MVCSSYAGSPNEECIQHHRSKKLNEWRAAALGQTIDAWSPITDQKRFRGVYKIKSAERSFDLMRSLVDPAEEARERPFALKLTRCLGVVETVLVVNVHDVVVADGRRARGLDLLIIFRPTHCEHLGLAKALAQRLKLGIVLRKSTRVALDGAHAILNLLQA